MINMQIEKCFKRAFILTFRKKKILFSYPFLFLCGIIAVFFRSFAYSANKWINLSVSFLPIFISFSVLAVLGLLLGRIYYGEIKSLKISYFQTFKKVFEVLFTSIYIFILPILIFLFLWIVFGIFIALKELPHIGSFIGVLASIVPFIIILSCIMLGIMSFFALFFIVPYLLLKNKNKISLIKEFFLDFSSNILTKLLLFLSASGMLFLSFYVLFISCKLTNFYFSLQTNFLYDVLKSFFLMIPFTFFMTPFVIFFFNLAMETHNLFLTRER